MNHTKTWHRLFALTVVSALVLAACGGSSSSKSSGPTTPTTAPLGKPEAGTLVLGAEQEPSCADWIDACAGASWGLWTMQEHTVPRAFDVVSAGINKWTYQPSNLLAAPPTLTPGTAAVVTYKINPAAVWSDGAPITSADFKYTWQQIATGKNVYSTTGYTNIASIDATDPATAVVTFKPNEFFGAWRSLFGYDYGVWPSHLLQGKNRDALTKNGYSWSGGPWVIQKWDRGIGVTLVPNSRYWGDKPKIQKVVFKFIPDTAAEFKAFQTGDVFGIYPQPQLDAVDAIKAGLPNAKTTTTADTASIEALWMNNAKAPLDSVPVRQAIAYAIDRNAIVARLFGSLGVKDPSQSLNPPIVSSYGNPQAWAAYTLNLAKVSELLTGDGWAKGSDGIWAKSGKKLSLTMTTTAGNKRRELTEQIIQQELAQAGIQLKVSNQSSDQLFGTTLVNGSFQLALYAQTNTNLDPGLCVIMCSTNIPTKANSNSGQNYTRTNIPAIDPPLQTVDTSTDDQVRAASETTADNIMAAQQVTLPLDPLPNIAIWSTRIGGNLSDNPISAMFWNMNEWQLTG